MKHKSNANASTGYSLFQNLVYYYRVLRRFKSKVIQMVATDIPITILGTLIATYTPKLILDRLEFGDTFMQAAFVIIAIFTAKLFADLIKNGSDARKSLYNLHTCYYFEILRYSKEIDLDYDSLEDPEVQHIARKAHIQNNHIPAMNIPSILAALVINFANFFIFGGILSQLNPVIILILILTTLINMPVQKWLRNYEYKQKDEEQKNLRKLQYLSNTSSNFKIAKDVRLFNMKEWLNSLIALLFKEYKKLRLHYENRRFITFLINFVILFLRDGAAYAYLIWRAVQGDLSAGNFILYFSAIASFSEWVSGIIANWSEINRASLQLSDIRRYLDLPNHFNHGQGIPLPPKNEPLEIKLIDVSFTYPGAAAPTLNHINLTIRPGQKLAIVGLNGAGKTTLVKLLCGLYAPTSGKILVDGHEINEYNRTEYYSMISAVFQISSLLPITIAENIASTDQAHIDQARLDNAIRLANFQKKLGSLPMGAATPINKAIHPDGVELSGGEIQRLLLARAIYKDANILILDEPTSALDPIAESEIYQSYQQIAQNRTSIFISHRLATTRFCDCIAFLDSGSIAELGTHDELIQRGAGYAKLFEVQSQYYNDHNTDSKEVSLC